MIAADLQTDNVRDLYRDLILDHARNPRHFGKLDHATHTAEGINPLCGDKLRLYLDVDPDETIRSAAFEGSGCAISVASASLLTDTIIGLSSSDAIAFFDAVTAQLAGDDPQGLDTQLETLVASGAHVHRSNADAVRHAAQIATGAA